MSRSRRFAKVGLRWQMCAGSRPLCSYAREAVFCQFVAREGLPGLVPDVPERRLADEFRARSVKHTDLTDTDLTDTDLTR